MKTKKKGVLLTLREIRDRQSEKYYKNPALLKHDLEKIRRKYGLKKEPLASGIPVSV